MMWKTINEITNHKKRPSSDIKRLKNDNGVESHSPSEIANCLNNYFNSIGHDMANKIPQHLTASSDPVDLIRVSPTQSMYLFNTSVEEVLKLISLLKLSKAPGMDGISNYIIKITADIIAPILTTLFNDCQKKGIFPDPLKIAKIVPIHKGGPKDNPTNYRPISLLPQIGKIFEKILEKRIVKFCNKYNIITSHQFGFRKGFSTELAVLKIKSILLKNLDQKKHTCTIFLDLAKAFDSVDHNILLKKLEKYGIRGTPLKLIRSYLSGRQHLVRVGNSESELRILDIGVPQGSVLGPLLFLLFINDLPNCSKFKVLLFADDTCLSLESNNFKQLQKEANKELKKINRWLTINKLTLNISKSKFMIVKRHTKDNIENVQLKINGKKLERCSSYKYLGIYIDEKLEWKTHVKYVCEKVGRASGMLARLRYCVNRDLLKEVYYALVSSHLSYCNIVWGKASKGVLKPLVQLHEKIIRIMSFCPYGTHETAHIFADMNILNINQINTLEKAKFIYKHQNNKLPSSFDDYFHNVNEINNRISRNSATGNINIYPTVGRTCYGHKLLQNEGASIWNSIPNVIRNCETVKTFAKNMKTHLIRQIYA